MHPPALHPHPQVVVTRQNRKWKKVKKKKKKKMSKTAMTHLILNLSLRIARTTRVARRRRK